MDIDFKLSGGNGLNIFFGKGKIHYQWAQRQKSEEPTDFMDRGTAEEIEKQYSQPVEMYRMDVELIGSNPKAAIVTEDQQPYFERYFLSWVNKDNSNEGVKANAFKKITYKNIYPHIDWIFYFNKKGQLEHDFIVHPGGKVADIQMKYSGSTNLKLNANGSLTAHSPMGTITENAPYSMEQSGREVACNFKLEHGILSFAVADYSGILVIDPILEWGTYFGGSDDETSYALTTDKWGNVYMTGSTGSLSNIATTGAYQATYGGGTNYLGADAFLSKWNMEGNLLWATYYGGDKIDVAKGVGCDTSGNAYIGGYTNSMIGISTVVSYQEVKAGTSVNNYDAFLVKFDSSGQRVWGTYYGGASQDGSTSLSLTTDNLNNVYLSGNTQSNDLPTSQGCHQPSFAGGHDVFITQFNSDGTFGWSTYYGGPATDHVGGISTDSFGNLYVTGPTQSINGISTLNAFQPVIGGNYDAFLSKFDNTGQLIWATYFGGSAQDRGNAISINENQIYIGGLTQSLSEIATVGAHQNTFASTTGGDGFLACFDPSGILNWATYFGGEDAEAVTGIYSNQQSVYISGQTKSMTGIATLGSFQDTYQGSTDIFLAKLNASGQLQWGTYYGGGDLEGFGYLTGDEQSNVYLSGYTNSGIGIATLNGYNNTFNGGNDAFIVRFNDCEAPELPSLISGNIEVCENSHQTYSVVADNGAAEYKWLLPNGWIGNSDSNSIDLIIGNNDGEIKVVAISECGGVSDTQSLAIAVLTIPNPVIVNNNNILSTTQSYSTYHWNKSGTGIPNAMQSTFTVEENGDYSVTVTNNNDCENTSGEVSITGIVGIEHLAFKGNFKLYPNPVEEGLNIESTENAIAELLGIDGRVLRSLINIHSGVNVISLKELSTGMYFLKIKNDQNQFKMMKIVKE